MRTYARTRAVTLLVSALLAAGAESNAHAQYFGRNNADRQSGAALPAAAAVRRARQDVRARSDRGGVLRRCRRRVAEERPSDVPGGKPSTCFERRYDAAGQCAWFRRRADGRGLSLPAVGPWLGVGLQHRARFLSRRGSDARYLQGETLERDEQRARDRPMWPCPVSQLDPVHQHVQASVDPNTDAAHEPAVA